MTQKQCIESKLGRVHNAHTHGLGCAHAAPMSCAQRRVVERVGSYRGPLPNRIVAVLQACTDHVVAHGRRVAGLLLRAVSCAGSRRVAAPPAVSQAPPYRVAACTLPYRSVVARYIATPGLPLLSRYTHLYRDTPSNGQALCARAPLALRAGRLCRSVLLRPDRLCHASC